MVEGKETVEVEEVRCDKALRPFEINYCRLPCPGHCVVTNWSMWSRCAKVSRIIIIIISHHIISYHMIS